ncbi:hypothetical protein [Streptomyces sp. NPDC059452]|uniref:hypothetical protein n=1 Tax=Streptomyces sp. NPDC059452 TaxID=3346835 RepID=UPI00369F8F23
MLAHVIPPPWGYTKSAHDLVRHKRLDSDAKILVIYIQGLPEGDRDKALSEHARALRITGRRYQKAKAELVACGYVHEKRETIAGGRWRTVQVFSNCPLTDDQAARLRAGVPADGYEVLSGLGGQSGLGGLSAGAVPSVHFPTVGGPSGRVAGGQLPADEEQGENYSHPPTEGDGGGDSDLGCGGDGDGDVGGESGGGPEVDLAERVLLSLRHERRDLHLGVSEARSIAGLAAEWLRRGVAVGDLRKVLSSGLPSGGVRSAVHFLGHRLREKLPASLERAPELEPEPEPVPPPPALITCAGPGEEHVFRPNVPWATTCGPCHQEEQRAYWADVQARGEAAPPTPPWRERFAAFAEGVEGVEGAGGAGGGGGSGGLGDGGLTEVDCRSAP